MRWSDVLEEVAATLTELREDGCIDPFYRGQADAAWPLLPTLARIQPSPALEGRLYDNFRTYGGHLFPDASPWEVLLLMQHHGIPTRLLDWSESFAVALYFAVKQMKTAAAVWVLDPYKLNLHTLKTESVEYLETSFPSGYAAYFAPGMGQELQEFPAPIVSVATSRVDPRMQWQRAVFTFHADVTLPLEEKYPDAVKKIVIPASVRDEASSFLMLAGLNEASVFPDLDGIARHIKETEL